MGNGICLALQCETWITSPLRFETADGGMAATSVIVTEGNATGSKVSVRLTGRNDG